MLLLRATNWRLKRRSARTALIFAIVTTLPGEALTGYAVSELDTDDPPLYFRVTGFSDTSAGVVWEVPRGRSITNFVLQRYEHDDTVSVSDGNQIDGPANGGSGRARNSLRFEPDIRYKFTLKLSNAANITFIESSVTLRTQTTPPPSSDATLSSLSLSGEGVGPRES